MKKRAIEDTERKIAKDLEEKKRRSLLNLMLCELKLLSQTTKGKANGNLKYMINLRMKKRSFLY